MPAPTTCKAACGTPIARQAATCVRSPASAWTRSGEQTVRELVGAIKASSAWREGRNAIVLLRDENDFSVSPCDRGVAVMGDLFARR